MITSEFIKHYTISYSMRKIVIEVQVKIYLKKKEKKPLGGVEVIILTSIKLYNVCNCISI